MGLSGEVRSVGQAELHSEAARLGFRKVLIPRTLNRQKLRLPEGVETAPVRSVHEAIDLALTWKV